MAAGKSTVGRLLADALSWELVDLDVLIARRAGRSVPEIFAERGEAAFREMEAEATREIADRLDMVLAAGGGWVQQPALLRSVRARSVVVWLRVSAPEAVRRARALEGERPLLAGPDPLGAAESLLRQRQSLYATADIVVETEGRTAADVADEIMERLKPQRRVHGGQEV